MSDLHNLPDDISQGQKGRLVQTIGVSFSALCREVVTGIEIYQVSFASLLTPPLLYSHYLPIMHEHLNLTKGLNFLDTDKTVSLKIFYFSDTQNRLVQPFPLYSHLEHEHDFWRYFVNIIERPRDSMRHWC